MLQLREQKREAQWQYVQSILMTVGNMTISWAGVERILDELIAWYQVNCTDMTEQHPVSLSNKLTYIRAMQRDARFTEETQEFLRRVRIDAKRIGNERHQIIHGMLTHKGGFTLNWQSQRIVYRGPHATLTSRDYHHDDLMRISAEITAFTRYLSPKVWVLTGNNPRYFPVRDIEDALSEFGFR